MTRASSGPPDDHATREREPDPTNGIIDRAITECAPSVGTTVIS
jgi:hypothetical protein